MILTTHMILRILHMMLGRNIAHDIQSIAYDDDDDERR